MKCGIQNFNEWLATFIEEKDVHVENYIFDIEHNETIHLVELYTLIEVMKIASEYEKSCIKNTLVKIDFYNGDIFDYFKYLAKAYVVTNF